ncbi:MAG: hypothetical protein VW057_09100, partial [Rhodospirillaceae bacterium]
MAANQANTTIPGHQCCAGDLQPRDFPKIGNRCIDQCKISRVGKTIFRQQTNCLVFIGITKHRGEIIIGINYPAITVDNCNSGGAAVEHRFNLFFAAFLI